MQLLDSVVLKYLRVKHFKDTCTEFPFSVAHVKVLGSRRHALAIKICTVSLKATNSALNSVKGTNCHLI